MLSVLITPSANSTYTVIGTDANGCVNSDIVSVTVNPIRLQICIRHFCARIQHNFGCGNTGSTFSWSTGEFTPELLQLTDSGNYTVVAHKSERLFCSWFPPQVTVGGGLNAVPSTTAVCAGQFSYPECRKSWLYLFMVLTETQLKLSQPILQEHIMWQLQIRTVAAVLFAAQRSRQSITGSRIYSLYPQLFRYRYNIHQPKYNPQFRFNSFI